MATVVAAVDSANKPSTQKQYIDPLIAVPKKYKLADLFSEAQHRWELCEEEVRQIMKNHGHTQWNEKLYDQYLALCRWAFIQKMVVIENERIKAKQEEIDKLLELERTLTMGERKDGSGVPCWEWVGTEEALAAHWKLEDLRREENRRFVGTKRRYQLG